MLGKPWLPWIAASLLAGCGARSQLKIPDLAFDAVDAVDVTDACIPGRFTLQPRVADVLLMIDRSNSMTLDLMGNQEPPSRWTLLTQALESTLPAIDSTVHLGAVFFPRVVNPGDDILGQCSVNTSADEVPMRSGAQAILNVLQTTQPGGGTPTYVALRLAQTVVDATAGRGDARIIVLATDGGPNCNGTLDPNTCQCTSSSMGMPDCAPDQFAFNCLDDNRTISEMQTIAASGVPIYVIGIADMDQMGLEPVLNRMAVAGGRPNPNGPEQYYSVRQPQDLVTAFTTIQNAITRCAFVTPSRPTNLDGLSVSLGSATVPRDPSRMNGWDWTDPAFGEITLFGAACDQAVANPTEPLTVQVGCDTGVDP